MAPAVDAAVAATTTPSPTCAGSRASDHPSAGDGGPADEAAEPDAPTKRAGRAPRRRLAAAFERYLREQRGDDEP